MRKLIYVVGAILVLGIGAFGYFYFAKSEAPITISHLVPDEALWVYQSRQFPDDWARIQQTPPGSALSSIPDLRPVAQSLAQLDSLLSLTDWLSDLPCFVVGQVIGNDDLGFSFYIELDDPKASRYQDDFEELIQGDPDWRVEARQYQGVTIHEWAYVPLNSQLSWITSEKFLIASFTPFLIEDQIRRQKTPVSQGWLESSSGAALSQRDQGNLYLNGQLLQTLFSVFTSEKRSTKGGRDLAFCRTMGFDLTVEDNQWLLSGFSALPDGSDAYQNFFLSISDEQSAVPFNLGDYLPSRTATFRQFATTDVQEWAARLLQFRQRNAVDSVHFQRILRAFEEKTASSLPDWFAWAGDEIGMVTLESSGNEPPDILLVTEIADFEMMQAALDHLQNPSDTLTFQEQFAGYTLRSFKETILPALLLGDETMNQLTEYFWFQDTSYLVMSNNVTALKRLISDQSTESTWSKSVAQSRFLEQSLDPATYSVVVSLPRYWEQWVSQLSPKWADWARSQKPTLQKIGKIAVQFSPVDDEYYSSLSLGYQPQPTANVRSTFSTTNRVYLDTTLSTKPYVVRNHISQQREVLVQDKSGEIHLVSPTDEEVIWSDSLGQAIVGDIYQIDYFRNGKLQYLFATDSALHVVDRTGQEVSGFPLFLPNGIRIAYLSLFDYDQTRDYRWLITDRQGKLWMYNQDREPLPGWSPLPTAAPLAEAPQHLRVRGKDCIIALQRNGLLHVFNRRGEEYPGFPVNWEQPCHNPIFAEVGNSFATTRLTTITDAGELISVNLEGNLLRRDQQFRASSNSQFLLSPDRLGKTFVLARQDDQRLSLLDANGKPLFDQSYFTPGSLARNELSIQYYDFGAGNQIVAITDKIQDFTYLFDETGKLKNDRPIESTNEIGLLYSEASNQYRIYRVYDDELSIVSF